jgi:hypothetical protein
MGRVEDGQPVHDLGVLHCGGPGNGSTPVVPDQHRLLGSALLDQAADVGRQLTDVVSADAVRLR